MKQIYRTSCCIAAALALGGCQSFVNALGFGPKPAQTEQRAEVFGSEELQKGRLALEQGNIASAIQQFRLAALNESHAADAFNGLGVSYARLGRADLAERYFQAAVKVDPSNPKYAANLSRFYQSPLGNSARALAMREAETQALLAQAEKTAVEEGLIEPEIDDRGAVAISTPAPAQVERVSENEVAIAPAAKTDTPAARQPVRQAEIQIRSAPQPEAAASRVSQDSQTAIAEPRRARITVSRGGPRWSASPRSRNYPVRISLRRGSED